MHPSLSAQATNLMHIQCRVPLCCHANTEKGHSAYDTACGTGFLYLWAADSLAACTSKASTQPVLCRMLSSEEQVLKTHLSRQGP